MRKLSLHLLQVLVRNVRTNECLIYISTTGQTVKFYAIGEIHFKMVLSTVDTFLPTYLPTYLPTQVGRYQNVWLYKSSNANFVGTIIWLDLYSQGFAFGEKFKNDICHTIKITILELLDPADDVINTFQHSIAEIQLSDWMLRVT